MGFPKMIFLAFGIWTAFLSALYTSVFGNSAGIPITFQCHTHTCLFCAQVTKSCSLIQDVTLSLMHSANKFANAMPVFVHTDNTKLAKS